MRPTNSESDSSAEGRRVSVVNRLQHPEWSVQIGIAVPSTAERYPANGCRASPVAEVESEAVREAQRRASCFVNYYPHTVDHRAVSSMRAPRAPRASSARLSPKTQRSLSASRPTRSTKTPPQRRLHKDASTKTPSRVGFVDSGSPRETELRTNPKTHMRCATLKRTWPAQPLHARALRQSEWRNR